MKGLLTFGHFAVAFVTFWVGLIIGMNYATDVAEDVIDEKVPEILKGCDPTDLSVCKLHLYTAEDYKRMYKESYDRCDEQRQQLFDLASRCNDSLAKVVGAPEGTEALP